MHIELTRIFVKVVQNGSFSKAANLLKVPKSTVSKAITRLEKNTGTKLLLRTTRSLTLTAAGRAFFDTCFGPIQILEDAQKSLYGQDSILSGLVRITAPEDLGNHVIAPAVAELSRKHSELSFELNYTDEVIDLVKDGYDLAIRIGNLRESSLKVRKLGEIELIMVATASYLKKRGKIREPSDLVNHDTLSISVRTMDWQLGKRNVKIKPRIISNQMTSLLKMANAGAGIAQVPLYLAKPEIESGRLIHILPDWNTHGLNVSMLSPIASTSSMRLKVVSDYLYSAIQKAVT